MASIADVVNVTITRETRTVSQAGFGTVLILGSNQPFAVNTARLYSDITEVAADYATSDEEYLAAAAIFNQTPRPVSLKIGTRATPVAEVQTLTLDADLVTGNTASVTVDNVVVSEAFATDHVTTMNAWAAAIQAQPGVASAVVSGPNNRVITITAAVAGIPVLLSAISITGGASQANIASAVTVANVGVTEDLNAITLFDPDWYALIITGHTAKEALLGAAYAQSAEKLFGTVTSDVATYDLNSTTDIGALLQAANYDRSFVVFNETPTDYADAAWMGRVLPEDPGTVTWKFKGLAGITASPLTSSQRSNVLSKNVNVYTTRGGQDMMEEGTTAQGEFIDVIRGMDWLKARMAENIFGALLNAKKIPYTNKGIAVIENLIRKSLNNAIARGVLQPDPDQFGGEPYLLSVPKLADISPNDIGARLLPDITWQATLAGAIHKVTIQGRVVL